MRAKTVLQETTVPSNTVRCPEPKEGTATIVRRYRQGRAVVLHPADYERLLKDSELVAALGSLEPLPPPTPLERRLLAEVDTPGAEAAVLEDYEKLSAWLAAGDRES